MASIRGIGAHGLRSVSMLGMEADGPALTIGSRVSTGPAGTVGRWVNVELDANDVRSLLASIAMMLPDQITALAAAVVDADALAQGGPYDQVRFGRQGFDGRQSYAAGRHDLYLRSLRPQDSEKGGN